MSLRDKIKQTEENIRRFRQEEEHKLLLELQIEEGILVNRLLEREEQIREMLAEFQEEKEEEELEMDGLSEPISQDRIDQRRLIYDGFEHIQDYEVRLLKELREKIAMIKSPDHVAEEQRRQDELQRRQEEEQRQVALYRRRQDELRLQYEESRRRDELQRSQEESRADESRRRDELQRRQEESRQADERRRQDELQRRQEESRRQNWSFEVSREYDRMYGGRTPQELREMEESLQRERDWYDRFGR
jgi:hypothetical protein